MSVGILHQGAPNSLFSITWHGLVWFLRILETCLTCLGSKLFVFVWHGMVCNGLAWFNISIAWFSMTNVFYKSINFNCRVTIGMSCAIIVYQLSSPPIWVFFFASLLLLFHVSCAYGYTCCGLYTMRNKHFAVDCRRTLE